MYILRQTQQAPFQFNWCGNGLTNNSSGGPTQFLGDVSGNTPVYINPNGTPTPGNIYTNKKGSLTYSLTSVYTSPPGQNPQTTTTTSAPPYADTESNDTARTNYTLKITDQATGQQYTFLNSVIWGPI